MTNQRRTEIAETLGVALLILVLCGVLLAISGLLSNGAVIDNRLILSRYAAQLQAGNGLVFNPGERYLLIFAPLYMLLEAISSPAILFVAATVIAGTTLYRLGRRLGLRRGFAFAAAAIYVLSAPLWMAYATAFPLMTALVLVALELILGARWSLAGLLIGLATFCSPEALILGVVLLIYALQRGKGWPFALPLIAVLGAGGAGLAAYYGPTLWDGLLTLKRSHDSTNQRLIAWVFMGALGLVAWLAGYRERTRPEIALLGAWIGLYALIVGVLLRDIDGWRFLPVVGVGALLGGLFIQKYRLALIPAVLIAGGSFGLLWADRAALPSSDARATYGASGASVGVIAKAEALLAVIPPATPITLFNGEFQPELKKMLERGDERGVLIRYAPALLVGDGAWDEDLLRALDYRPDTILKRNKTYRRYSALGAFANQEADIAYGPDLRLYGFALDQTALNAAKPGWLRVRLDWEIAHSASRPLTLAFRLLTENGIILESSEELDSGIFRLGRYSTYHVLQIPALAGSENQARVQVAVILNGGTLDRVTLASLPITR